MASRRGLSPLEMAYEILLQRDGRGILYAPETNFTHGTLDTDARDARASGHADWAQRRRCPLRHHLRCQLQHVTYLPIGRVIGNAVRAFAYPLSCTRSRSEALAAVGLDRGVVAVGTKADLNIIDFDRVQLRSPQIARDLPAGGRRLTQQADGYVATIVNGITISRGGEAAQERCRAGRLVRGTDSGSVLH